MRSEQDTLRQHVDRFGSRSLERGAWRHGVEGLVDLALESLGRASASSREARVASAVHHARVCALLEKLGSVLDGAGTPWVAVKGPVLAGYHYERPDLRRYVDLDVLVHPSRFADALMAAEGLGLEVYERNWPLMHDVGAAELRLVAADRPPVDLHWHLVSDGSVRRRFPVPVAELLERRREVDLQKLSVPTLDPVDTLLHVSLHAALAGAVRLVWLVDADRVVARDDLDWDQLVRRAVDWGAAPHAGLVLRGAVTHLRTAVPEEVLDALGPRPAWRAPVALVSRLSPVGTARTDASLHRLVVKSTRRSSVASWRALGTNAASWLAGRAAPTSSPADPARHDRGGDAARRFYLAAVGQQR